MKINSRFAQFTENSPVLKMYLLAGLEKAHFLPALNDAEIFLTCDPTVLVRLLSGKPMTMSAAFK